MVFFTADNHFGHANIIKSCRRPYADAAEMDADMLARWNDRVTPRDTVYILGDLIFRSEDPEAILRQLNGQLILITGNHDGQWMKRVPDFARYFTAVYPPYVELSDGAHKLTLSHYPLLSFNDHEGKAFMVYGHIHNQTDELDFFPLLCRRPWMLNAGADVNGFRPVTFDELRENNRAFQQTWMDQKRSRLNQQNKIYEVF